MKPKVEKHLAEVLHHLYINPLEKCNLRCQICYTRKTDPILSLDEILSFVSRYEKTFRIDTITFCGGEVFTLPYFTALLNTLIRKGIFIQIITNGTIDRLEEIVNPNMINLIVSIDGLREDHDANRGEGNFAKSVSFLKKAQKYGFHTEIFSIITKRNIEKIDAFEKGIEELLGHRVSITYHPRKPPTYLLHHPFSNIFGEINGFDFLKGHEMLELMKTRNVFPPKNLGCYQIALTSDGKVFGCCEGTLPIGRMSDPIHLLAERLRERLSAWDKLNTPKSCLGCSQPDFMCGIRRYLEMIT